MITHAQLDHALRIMAGLDAPALVSAGVLPHGDPGAFVRYRRNPARFFLTAEHPAAIALFGLVLARLAPAAPATHATAGAP